MSSYRRQTVDRSYCRQTVDRSYRRQTVDRSYCRQTVDRSYRRQTVVHALASVATSVISRTAFKCGFLVWIVVACVANPTNAFQDGDTLDQEKFLVGTKVSPPFSLKRADGTWTGISIELWREIAADLHLECEFRELEMQEIIDGLERGELDAGIAAISITAERDEHIDFSHSYYSTGLGVAVPRKQSLTIWRFIANLLTGRFLITVGVLVAAALVAGVIFWSFERKKNEGLFGGRTKEGVSMGIWWSTIMLLGHKGVIPATGVSRFLAIMVMVASTVAVSALTGIIASAITVARIGHVVSHPDDLRHLRIASVASSTSVEYLRGRHLRFQEYPSVDSALLALAEGNADAVVYDLGMLKYQRNNEFENVVEVLPLRFNEQQYAIALPANSELRETLNRSLLRFTGSDAWSDVLYRYLGE